MPFTPILPNPCQSDVPLVSWFPTLSLSTVDRRHRRAGSSLASTQILLSAYEPLKEQEGGFLVSMSIGWSAVSSVCFPRIIPFCPGSVSLRLFSIS